MKRFFEFQQAFALIALTGFLALGTLSCDKDDDDDSTGSSAAVFKFKGGVDSTDDTVLEGEEVSSDYANTCTDGLASSGTSGKCLPARDITAKLCSFFLEKSGSPTITLWKTEEEAGTDIGADDTNTDAKAISDNIVTALGGEAKGDGNPIVEFEEYQGYRFTVQSEGTGASGTLKVKVVPRLNEAYKAGFKMDAPADGCKTPTDLLTEAFTATSVTEEEKGKSARAIRVFEKGKDDKSGSISLDGFSIDLPESPYKPSQIVSELLRNINKNLSAGANDEAKAEHFKSNAEEYPKGVYKADIGGNATKCDVPKATWKSGSFCLILERVLHGTAGNGKIEYKEDYTKAK